MDCSCCGADISGWYIFPVSPEKRSFNTFAGDVKHQVGNTVKAACYGYRFQSFGEYKALLAAYNVCAEEVKGEINGKP